MDEYTLRILEYDKIIRKLARLASFSGGKDLCEALVQSTDIEVLKRAQAETTEARSVIRSAHTVPYGGISDIRDLAARASIGAVLSAEELLRVADTVLGARRVKKSLLELREDHVLLRKMGELIEVPGEIEVCIRDAVTDNAVIKDEASPELLRIRRSLRVTQARIRDRLDALVRSPEVLKYLQEPLITIRVGRFVLPVKAEYRAQVPGIVHDQSQSGATLFIEPMASVEANNELRKLELEERDEIERILTRLSAQVGGEDARLSRMVESLAEVDLVFAKGRLSVEMDANEPLITDDRRIDIRKARHPLLTGEVVPIDVRLGLDFDTLVITGPNTGGKTVSLKTVGLCVLMAQAGLHVPAASGSRLSLFHRVFCDIGDEQSIEQNLSTFSSHMKNIVVIVNEATEGSLVLLDEIGAGTDPAEGSRLAMALLEYLHSAGARTIATTHYSELKSFAYTRSRVENASVEFDVETLRPTYRLSIGLPGRSNAFLIARRLGLKQQVIERAIELMTDEHMQVEKVIGEIQASKSALDREVHGARQAHARASQTEADYKKRLEEIARREREILDRARQQAASLLGRVRSECDEALKVARRTRDDASSGLGARRIVRDSLSRARDMLQDVEPETLDEETYEQIAPDKVHAGSTVFIRSLSKKGEVLEPPDPQQNVTVRVGVIRTQVKLSDLSPAEPDDVKTGREHIGRLMQSKAQGVSPEVSLRGLTADEAIEVLDKYLDDAVLSGLGQVRVIHGKGTGTLRKAVQEWLRTHPSVASQRFGDPAEGGDGVTLVTIKS